MQDFGAGLWCVISVQVFVCRTSVQDFDAGLRMQDVWGRNSVQVFGA